MKSSEDQEAPGTSTNETTNLPVDQEAPQTSGDQTTRPQVALEAPVDQTTRSPEDQEVPGSRSSSEEVRHTSCVYLTFNFTSENILLRSFE